MVKKTKAEAEATRESLLDAAELAFLEKGVDKASLEEIARLADVTRGAVYWHFRNKEDLFDAMLSRVRLPFATMVEQLTQQEQADLSALRALCLHALEELADNARHQRVYTILLHRTSSDFGRWQQHSLSRQSIDQITRFFLLHGQSALHPALSPARAALFLHTQMLGIFYDWLRDPSAWSLRTEAPALVETLFRGLCGTDSTQRRAV